MESKSRSEILLEEKVDQIDDANFSKVYDLDEIADKEIDNFDNEIIIGDLNDLGKNSNEDVEFSIELQPNEFLDNLELNKEESVKKQKLKISHKPLFFAFTSIVALLCILFIYNMFVINSLEFRAGKAWAVASTNNKVEVETQSDSITFDNNNTMKIEAKVQEIQENKSQTNWFDQLILKVSQLFGGNY